MSTTTPSASPSSPSATSSPAAARTQRESIIHNLSLAALIVCPVILALPPRRVNFTSFLLTGGFFAGGNELAREYSGASIVDRFGSRVARLASHELPPKAQETQRRLREEKERMALGFDGRTVADAEGKGALAEMKRREEERKERGLLEKVWMGSEGDDWKAKRDAREKAALEEGRGYGGLIVDQIWEVINWGKDKAEEVKEIDEKVVEKEKTEVKKK